MGRSAEKNARSGPARAGAGLAQPGVGDVGGEVQPAGVQVEPVPAQHLLEGVAFRQRRVQGGGEAVEEVPGPVELGVEVLERVLGGADPERPLVGVAGPAHGDEGTGLGEAVGMVGPAVVVGQGPLAELQRVGQAAHGVEGLQQDLAVQHHGHVGGVRQVLAAQVGQRLVRRVLGLVEVRLVAAPQGQVVRHVPDVAAVVDEERRVDRLERPVVVVGGQEHVVQCAAAGQGQAQPDVAGGVVGGRAAGPLVGGEEVLLGHRGDRHVGVQALEGLGGSEHDDVVHPGHEVPEVVQGFPEDRGTVGEVDDLHRRGGARGAPARSYRRTAVPRGRPAGRVGPVASGRPSSSTVGTGWGRPSR